MRNVLRHGPLLGTLLLTAMLVGAIFLLAGQGRDNPVTTMSFASPPPAQVSMYYSQASQELPIVLTALSTGSAGHDAIYSSTDKLLAISAQAQSAYPASSTEFKGWSKVSKIAYKLSWEAHAGMSSYGDLRIGGLYDQLRAAIVARS